MTGPSSRTNLAGGGAESGTGLTPGQPTRLFGGKGGSRLIGEQPEIITLNDMEGKNDDGNGVNCACCRALVPFVHAFC